MVAKRIPILVLVLVMPAVLMVLFLTVACKAQGDGPPPELLPVETSAATQEPKLVPSQPDAASIQLVKTVGLEPLVEQEDCPTAEFVYVPAGTRVYYCYRVINTGDVDLAWHDLVDDQLGTLFTDLEYGLPVGHSALYFQTNLISTTTVNAATWTARDDGETITTEASDRAGVFVAEPQRLVCGGPNVDFDQGIPPNWEVANQPADSPVYWTNVALSWESANYTGPNGDAASASSQLQNGGSGLHDTELRSPAFSLFGAGTVTLHYQANYQPGANDALDLDISTNGGLSWATLLHWSGSPHGDPHGDFGVPVAVDLSPYSGQENLVLRWRYYDLIGPESSLNQYAQIDQVTLDCETEAAIELTSSAQTDPACNGDEIGLVAPGTRLTYCYKVLNSGPSSLTQHDLVDSQLGDLLTGFSFNLAPGASAILPLPVTILTDTTSTATWTATNPDLGVSASDSDSLEIQVGQPIYLPVILK